MPRGASGSERVIRIVIKYLLFWLWIKYGFPAWKLVFYFYLRGPFGSFWGGLAEALFRAFWCLLKASIVFLEFASGLYLSPLSQTLQTSNQKATWLQEMHHNTSSFVLS